MVFESKHPLILHKLSILRATSTEPKQFRELARELAMMLGYEAMSTLEVSEKEIETPMGAATGRFQSMVVRFMLIPLDPVKHFVVGNHLLKSPALTAAFELE